MMIWDFIRDFFVQYIFGGYDSLGINHGGCLGLVNSFNSSGELEESYTASTCEIFNVIAKDGDGYNWSLSIGDWLSTTATIIVMCLIVFLLICLVRWIFRAVSSAMLLK